MTTRLTAMIGCVFQSLPGNLGVPAHIYGPASLVKYLVSIPSREFGSSGPDSSNTRRHSHQVSIPSREFGSSGPNYLSVTIPGMDVSIPSREFGSSGYWPLLIPRLTECVSIPSREFGSSGEFYIPHNYTQSL